MNLGPEYTTALVRGAVSGAFTAGVSFFTIAPVYGVTAGAYAAGVSFFSIMAARFGVEGKIDSAAAKKAEGGDPS